MKKLLTIVLLFCTTFAFAQERRIKEEGKTIFNPHWFVQIQGGAAHTIGEAKFADLISPSAALNVGYKFSPVFGVRAGASGWEAKGGWVTPEQTYKFKFVRGSLDLVADLGSLFAGFNPNRVFNPYLFVGGAYNYAFDNDEANALDTNSFELEYLWQDHKNFIAGRFGLGFDIRLSDRVALSFEGNANVLPDEFNSKKADNPDWHINALVGLNIKLGKGYTKTEPVYYEPEPVVEQKPEPAPAPVVKPEPKKEEPVVVEPMTQNIFFSLDSDVIEAPQQEKIDLLAKFLNENSDKKVNITGYADKETGNSNYNLKLSESRAKKVVDALVAKGVKADRIVVDYKGDQVQPFSTPEENRVTICITD